jgi:hypothetical protein
MSVLVFFLDGVGLGKDDPAVNPFSRVDMPCLRSLLGGEMPFESSGTIRTEEATLVPTDATLGVAGLPQSATGQTALLTGVNAPQVVGRHLGPWPGKALRALLTASNLFHAVAEHGGRPYFANAYPRQYFESLTSRRRRMSAIPFAAQSSGLELLGFEDLCSGHAFSVDFTGQAWRDHLGYRDAPIVPLREAGRRLARVARRHTVTVYDFWPPDPIGHDRNMAEAVHTLESLDHFLAGILDEWDRQHDLLVITSDHGNLEDLSRKTHTYNPVPTILIGAGHGEVASPIRDLTDIAPAVLSAIGSIAATSSA